MDRPTTKTIVIQPWERSIRPCFSFSTTVYLPCTLCANHCVYSILVLSMYSSCLINFPIESSLSSSNCYTERTLTSTSPIWRSIPWLSRATQSTCWTWQPSWTPLQSSCVSRPGGKLIFPHHLGELRCQK